MAHCDFVVKYDSSKDKPIDISKRILYSIIIKRLKAHKPAILFLGGDSGEGKSFASLTLTQTLLEIQGIDYLKHIGAVNVFTPIEYPKKLDALLNDKELKKVNVIAIHEARELVKAKLWYSFLNQSISDINAMSRSVKPLCIIVISQFIRDISNDIRYTLTYYCKVIRPKNKPARLYINVLWKDDRDLEKPRLRKRKLSGYLLDSKNNYRRFIPQYLELSKPSKEIIKFFEDKDKTAKISIIRKKIDNLIKEMEEDIGIESKKINAMVQWYATHKDNIHLIGKRIRGKFKVSSNFMTLHDLKIEEAKEFEIKLNERLKKEGVIEDE